MHHISFVGALQCLRLVGTHVRFVLERIAHIESLIGLGINKPVRQVPQLLRGLPLDRQRITTAEVQFRGYSPAAYYLLYLYVRQVVILRQIQGNLVLPREVLDHILITGADVVDKGVRVMNSIS